jgi:hypothetical protein
MVLSICGIYLIALQVLSALSGFAQQADTKVSVTEKEYSPLKYLGDPVCMRSQSMSEVGSRHMQEHI